MPVTATEVAIRFRRPPHDILGPARPSQPQPCCGSAIWPESEVGLTLVGKKPGAGWVPQREDLVVRAAGAGSDMRPYDRLIGAALDGERWLFARQETVEAAWRVVDPVLGPVVPVQPYARGSWGPKDADRLLPEGRHLARPGRVSLMDEHIVDHVVPRRVVIVGGGFAGLFAARELRHRPVEVTVVDRAAHHLFQPLLYQCATGVLSEGQIAVPLRQLFKRYDNVDCLLAEVTDVDVEAREVLALRPFGGTIRLPYDDLIVAAGVQQSYFGHDEFAPHAPGMKTLADALVDPAAGLRRFRDGARPRPIRPSGGAGSPSPWSAPARPAWSSPARSGSWPP